MSKWYEVKVTTVKVFAVEVEDNEDEDAAQKAAIDEAWDFDEVEASGPITDPVEVDRMRRHADEVLDLGDGNG